MYYKDQHTPADPEAMLVCQDDSLIDELCLASALAPGCFAECNEKTFLRTRLIVSRIIHRMLQGDSDETHCSN